MGREVLKGVFKYYDTKGLPIDVLFGFFKETGKQPCWISFFEDGLKAGWKIDTILLRLEEGIVDTWGKEYWKVVEERLRMQFVVT